MYIAGLGQAIGSAPNEKFVEIEISLDVSMPALDNPAFLTGRPYGHSAGQRSEHIFLKVSDIRRYPTRSAFRGRAVLRRTRLRLLVLAP